MESEKEELFATVELDSGIKSHAVKSMGVTALAQAFKLLLQVASIVILARLLRPADFGLIAMVTVFTGLALSIVDGGLSMATIQRKTITHAQVSNLFWINVCAGFSICVFSVMMAPAIAELYGEPGLVPVIYVLSSIFVMNGLSVQHDALLRRQMKFKVLAAVDIISVASGVFAAVFSAIHNLGHWALVIMMLVTTAVQVCLRWIFLSWYPSFLNLHSGTRPLLSFGINLTAANAVGYLVSNATPFFVGFIGGPQSLGYFNRAQSLTSIPSAQLLPPVIKVLQPILSRVSDDKNQYGKAIIELVRKIALLTAFVTVNMVVSADWIIAVLLGSDWEEAVPVFMILSVFTVVTPITTLIAVTLTAAGEAKALFYWRCITLALLIASLMIGANWGLEGVIAAFAISSFFVRMPLFFYFASCYLPFAFRDILSALRSILIIASLTVLTLAWTRHHLIIENPYVGLVSFLLLSLSLYLSMCLLVPSLRSEIIELRKLVHVSWNQC